MGAHAFWFGHPLKQVLAPALASIDPAKPRERLAVLPGSRTHEIDSNLPLLAKVLQGWPSEVEFAIAPGLDAVGLASRWSDLTGRQDLFTRGDSAGVLLRARAGLVCSGTATLEAALCQCPMVVFYELTPSMRREAKLIRYKRPRFISLPNIILQRESVPEHAQGEPLDPAILRADLDSIWQEGPERAAQLAAFDEINEMLGRSDAIARTAELGVSMLN
jgi:lipid-A-disaccharide synthase